MDNSRLFSEKCETQLIGLFRVTTPTLEKARMEHSIRKEVIDTSNAPNGFSFVPGNEYDYVLYVIPITQAELVSSFFKTGIQSSGLYINREYVFYKEHSRVQLLGNTQELERIRENAKAAIGRVEARLDELKQKAEDFNEKTLPSHIKTKIPLEREKRTTLKNSLDALKF